MHDSVWRIWIRKKSLRYRKNHLLWTFYNFYGCHAASTMMDELLTGWQSDHSIPPMPFYASVFSHHCQFFRCFLLRFSKHPPWIIKLSIFPLPYFRKHGTPNRNHNNEKGKHRSIYTATVNLLSKEKNAEKRRSFQVLCIELKPRKICAYFDSIIHSDDIKFCNIGLSNNSSEVIVVMNNPRSIRDDIWNSLENINRRLGQINFVLYR